MNAPIRLALCFVALAVFPLAATAQGFGQPGNFGPGSNGKKDDWDRDPFGVPRFPAYTPPGSHLPRGPATSPFPGSRFAGPNDASGHWDNPGFPGSRQPPGITGRPGEFTPVTPPPLTFDRTEIKLPPPEFTTLKPLHSSAFRPPPVGEVRGGLGILGVVGGCIAAFFRALFGRRKQE
jgi:hypothetical protein